MSKLVVLYQCTTVYDHTFCVTPDGIIVHNIALEAGAAYASSSVIATYSGSTLSLAGAAATLTPPGIVFLAGGAVIGIGYGGYLTFRHFFPKKIHDKIPEPQEIPAEPTEPDGQGGGGGPDNNEPEDQKFPPGSIGALAAAILKEAEEDVEKAIEFYKKHVSTLIQRRGSQE